MCYATEVPLYSPQFAMGLRFALKVQAVRPQPTINQHSI